MAVFKFIWMKKHDNTKRNTKENEAPRRGPSSFDKKLHPLTRATPLSKATVSPNQPGMPLDSGLISLSKGKQQRSFPLGSSWRDTTRDLQEPHSSPSDSTESPYTSEESIKLYKKIKRRGSCDLYQLKKVHRTKIFSRRSLLRGLENLHLRNKSLPPPNLPNFRLRTKVEAKPKSKLEPIRWPLLDANSDSDSDSHYPEESDDGEGEEDPEPYRLHRPTKLPRYQNVKCSSSKFTSMDRLHRAQTAVFLESGDDDDEEFFKNNPGLSRMIISWRVAGEGRGEIGLPH